MERSIKEADKRWRVIDSGTASAKELMERDAYLLASLDPSSAPILHHYRWKQDAATYGHFIDPLNIFDLARAGKRGLTLARRPTGGGVIFHLCDLAFSVLIPAQHPSCSLNTLDNYAFVNRLVIRAIRRFLGEERSLELLSVPPQAEKGMHSHFCLAHPTIYDVMLEGRKVGGAAQRRTRRGFLHQGSITLGLVDEEYLADVLLSGISVANAMRQNAYALLGEGWTIGRLEEARLTLRQCLQLSCGDER